MAGEERLEAPAAQPSSWTAMMLASSLIKFAIVRVGWLGEVGGFLLGLVVELGMLAL